MGQLTSLLQALPLCPNGLCRSCMALLYDASLDEVSLESIEDRIQSDEMSEAKGLDLWA